MIELHNMESYKCKRRT